MAPHARLAAMHAVEIEGVARRLREDGGGYQVVHASPGLELGVYVLVAPEPDRQQPHDVDEVYVVLEGNGVLEIEGRPVDPDQEHRPRRGGDPHRSSGLLRSGR